jgi:hypothetical protein
MAANNKEPPLTAVEAELWLADRSEFLVTDWGKPMAEAIELAKEHLEQTLTNPRGIQYVRLRLDRKAGIEYRIVREFAVNDGHVIPEQSLPVICTKAQYDGLTPGRSYIDPTGGVRIKS